MTPPSKNQPCPCGSGKKYKHCCLHVAPGQASSATICTAEGHALTLPQALQFAMQLHQAGRLRKAETLYRQILQFHPRHVDALHLLGLVRHQLGRHEEARTLIQQALALNPGAAYFHNNMGEVYRALNRPDDALASYRTAVSLQPALPEAHRNIGLAYLAKGQEELSVSYLREALQRHPDYLGLHLALGQALTRQSRPDEAIAILDDGLARSQSDAALLCAKGIALKAKGELEETIRHYRNAIKVQPHAAELHHNLALAFQEEGKIDDAIACLQEALRLNPNTDSARHLLAALQNTPTDRAPASYVRETFDAYADGFEHHLADKLGYRAPKLLATLLRKGLADAPERPLNVLDLGCGTGLFGEELRDLKKHFAGIDLSPRMIEKARGRGLYDELVVADLLDHLAETTPGRFDLIAATDVFIYLGDLLPVFREASRILDTGGWFAFSVEAPSEESVDFTLDQTGRYQHSRNYLARLGTQFGFSQSGFAEATLREEKGKPVAGYLYLLKRV